MANEFQLGGIVPWGRTAAEYEAFFGLADVAPQARILDCGGGPSSFTAEWRAQGRSVIAVDPSYRCSASAIARGFEDTARTMLAGMRKAHDRFRWDRYGSPENVVATRRRALERFLRTFQANGTYGAYCAASLPHLPFANDPFDLVLCSHLLFLYSEELDAETHAAFLTELLRVGREVRLFPLLDMNGDESVHLQPVLNRIRDRASTELVDVDFEFQCGATRMLRITRSV